LDANVDAALLVIGEHYKRHHVATYMESPMSALACTLSYATQDFGCYLSADTVSNAPNYTAAAATVLTKAPRMEWHAADCPHSNLTFTDVQVHMQDEQEQPKWWMSLLLSLLDLSAGQACSHKLLLPLY